MNSESRLRVEQGEATRSRAVGVVREEASSGVRAVSELRHVTTVPLSVLIPARNEARNLDRCLQPLVGWADEIVVADSLSTDATVPLAKEAGAAVLQFRYTGGWPKKRQWALDTHAWRNEWILLLDADEIVTEPLKREIDEAIRRNDHDGYWLSFQIVFLGRMLRHGDTAFRKLSLFRRGLGRYEQRLAQQDPSMADIEVHEHVVVRGRVGRLRHPVRHENWNSLDRYIAKHNEYSNWEAGVFLHGADGDLPPSLLGTQAQRRRWLKRKCLMLPGSPAWWFLYGYVVHLGFLDGRPGFVYAMFRFVQAFHVKAKITEHRLARN